MPCGRGGMVDATDLKSVDRKVVPVRVRPPAPPFALRASGGKPPAARTWGEAVPSEALAQEGCARRVLIQFLSRPAGFGWRATRSAHPGRSGALRSLGVGGLCATFLHPVLCRPAGFGWRATRSAHPGRRRAAPTSQYPVFRPADGPWASLPHAAVLWSPPYQLTSFPSFICPSGLDLRLQAASQRCAP
jgi:hypothetical protein